MGVAREQVLLRLRLKRRRRYQSPVGEVEPRAALGSFEGFAVPWKQLGFDFRSFKNRRDWKLIEPQRSRERKPGLSWEQAFHERTQMCG